MILDNSRSVIFGLLSYIRLISSCVNPLIDLFSVYAMVYFRLVDRRNTRPHAAGLAAYSRALNRGQLDIYHALACAMRWEAHNGRALTLAQLARGT